MRSFPAAVVMLLAGAGPTSLLAAEAAAGATPTLFVVRLRTEYKENPLGIDVRRPRLGWQLQSDGRGVVQSAYQVRVARTADDVRRGRGLVWDTGRVASAESVHCPYEGEPLPTLHFGDLALTSTRPADDAGARAQVARRQPDGTWLRILDRPDFLRDDPNRLTFRQPLGNPPPCRLGFFFRGEAKLRSVLTKQD